MDGEDVKEVESREHWKGDREKRKEIEGKALREESDRYYFLYKLNLFRSTCVEPDTYLLLNISLIPPCTYPRAEPTFVFLSLSYKFY